MNDDRLRAIIEELEFAQKELGDKRVRHRVVDEYDEWYRIEGTKSGLVCYATELLKASIHTDPEKDHSLSNLDWMEEVDTDIEVVAATVTDDFNDDENISTDAPTSLAVKICGPLALLFLVASLIFGMYNVIIYCGQFLYDLF